MPVKSAGISVAFPAKLNCAAPETAGAWEAGAWACEVACRKEKHTQAKAGRTIRTQIL